MLLPGSFFENRVPPEKVQELENVSIFNVRVKDRRKIGHASQVSIGGVVIRTQNAQRICPGLEGLPESTPLSARRGRRETGKGRGRQGVRQSLNPTSLKPDDGTSNEKNLIHSSHF